MGRMLQRYKDSRAHEPLVHRPDVRAGRGSRAWPSSTRRSSSSSHLFGGGSWARILHPFMGVLMCAGFLVLFLRLWRENVDHGGRPRVEQEDGRDAAGRQGCGMPPVGKYNYGQKMTFWAMAVSLAVLLVTGIMFWRPWFAPLLPDGRAARGRAAALGGRGGADPGDRSCTCTPPSGSRAPCER
jgi:formate dehydrogenase subunit gamma